MMTGSPHLKATGKMLEKNSSENEKAVAGSTLGHRTHKSCTGCSLDIVAGSCSCKKGTETGSAENWPLGMIPTGPGRRQSKKKVGSPHWIGKTSGRFLDHRSCTGSCLDTAAGSCSCKKDTETVAGFGIRTGCSYRNNFLGILKT